MTMVLAILLTGHGLIHLAGAVKGFDPAALPQLTDPISRASGVMWLVASVMFIAAAFALVAWPRWWWALGAGAVVLSTAAIAGSWNDARYGMAVNAIVLVGVGFGFLAQGPVSLRAAYDRDVAVALRRGPSQAVLRVEDVANLPPPVRRYLSVAGVVGRPHVHNFFVRMRGRIRSSATAPWMPIVAEQFSFLDPPARLFYLNGSMSGLPVQGYHRYVGSSACMRVKAAALFAVADESGNAMTRAETVTLFNDMCVFAPGTLVSPAIDWEPAGQRTARARFTNAGHTIHAELSFNDRGELADFHSDDRLQADADGGSMTPARWSTPLADYRSFGPVRLASRGEGRWRTATADYAYIELTIDDIRYNVRRGEGVMQASPWKEQP